MNLLELNSVSRHFGGVKAVDDLSLTVQRGQFVTLLGPSGCGKTTTLRLIAGFERPDAGCIRFKNMLLADKNTFVPPKDRHIGMVFQDYALFPHLNVAQNVAFGLRGTSRENAQRMAEMLELVDLQALAQRMPFELSGGQQQRVALARALAPAPEMLLLDEPFSSLDAALRTQLRIEMREILRQTHTTCIFVTHSQDEALSLSDIVAVIFEGRIAQAASPEMLYMQPMTLDIATFVGEANVIEGEACGDYVDTILGRHPLIRPAAGRVKVMIRPETLLITPQAIETDSSARIVWNEYYGHDRRIGLKFANDLILTARVYPTQRLEPHQTVSVTVQGPVLAY